MSEAESTGTLQFRIEKLETEQERQRGRIHDLMSEQTATRLLVQHATDSLEHLEDDVRSLKRAFYTFAFGAVGSAIVFALSVFAMLGRS